MQEQYSCCGNADLIAGPGLDDQFARVEPGGGTPESYFKDARNDTIVMTYPPGSNIAGHYYCEPFGNAITTNRNQGTNPHWFAGQEQVETAMNFITPSNLIHMRGRVYNSRLQRFMSPDPIGYAGGQINLYAYVNNDPMNGTDPSGLDSAGSFGAGPDGWASMGGSKTGTGWGTGHTGMNGSGGAQFGGGAVGGGGTDGMGGGSAYGPDDADAASAYASVISGGMLDGDVVGTGVAAAGLVQAGSGPAGGVTGDYGGPTSTGVVTVSAPSGVTAAHAAGLVVYNIGSYAYGGFTFGLSVGKYVGQPELGAGLGTLGGMMYGTYKGIQAAQALGIAGPTSPSP